MRILIVENEEVVTKVWKRFLEEQYEVVIAAHAPEAIQLLKESEIDLAILDLRLNGPTPSGMEVYNYLRKEYHRKTIPIIVVTGLEEGESLRGEAEEAIQSDTDSGINAVLIKKAVKVRDLLDTVREFLG